MPEKATWKRRITLRTYLHGSRQDEWKENCLKRDTVQTEIILMFYHKVRKF